MQTYFEDLAVRIYFVLSLRDLRYVWWWFYDQLFICCFKQLYQGLFTFNISIYLDRDHITIFFMNSIFMIKVLVFEYIHLADQNMFVLLC